MLFTVKGTLVINGVPLEMDLEISPSLVASAVQGLFGGRPRTTPVEEEASPHETAAITSTDVTPTLASAPVEEALSEFATLNAAIEDAANETLPTSDAALRSRIRQIAREEGIDVLTERMTERVIQFHRTSEADIRLHFQVKRFAWDLESELLRRGIPYEKLGGAVIWNYATSVRFERLTFDEAIALMIDYVEGKRKTHRYEPSAQTTPIDEATDEQKPSGLTPFLAPEPGEEETAMAAAFRKAAEKKGDEIKVPTDTASSLLVPAPASALLTATQGQEPLAKETPHKNGKRPLGDVPGLLAADVELLNGAGWHYAEDLSGRRYNEVVGLCGTYFKRAQRIAACLATVGVDLPRGRGGKKAITADASAPAEAHDADLDPLERMQKDGLAPEFAQNVSG